DDHRLRKACFSVFNEWAGEDVGYDRNRMRGFGLCDLADVANGVHETHRARDHGLRCVLIRSGPADERHYLSTMHEPLCSAADDLDRAMGMHILTGRRGKGHIRYGTHRKGYFDPTLSVSYVTTVLSELQQSLAHMVAGGVFERHPKLRVILLEADVGWIPHFV